jgi:hypothetical protein
VLQENARGERTIDRWRHRKDVEMIGHSDQDADWIDVLVLDRRWIKQARKSHTCNSCNDQIPAGTPYRRTAVLVDGEFGVYREHHSHSYEGEYE